MTQHSPAAGDAGRGILWMVIAVFWFLVLDTIAKDLLQRYPAPQVVWARFAGHMLFAALTVAFLPRSFGPGIRSANVGYQLARSGLLLATTCLFFLGVREVALTTAATIMFLAPLLITALSVPLLGEAVGWRRWLGVLLGFAGAVIVVRPGPDGISIAALYLLGAALINSLYQLSTRQIRLVDSTAVTYFYTALAGAVAMSLVTPFYWTTPAPFDLLLFAGMGVAGGVSHLCLVLAFRSSQASVVAPISYTGLVWAALFGYLVFGDIPDRWTLLGAALIVGSGLYVFHRERTLARHAQAAAAGSP